MRISRLEIRGIQFEVKLNFAAVYSLNAHRVTLELWRNGISALDYIRIHIESLKSAKSRDALLLHQNTVVGRTDEWMSRAIPSSYINSH